MGDTFVLRNLSTSDDTVLLRRLLRQLRSGTSSVFYCDNAGTVARFLLAILAVSRGSFVLSGDDSLCACIVRQPSDRMMKREYRRFITS